MEKPSKEKIQEAKDIYGVEVVGTVLEIVYVSDPDGAWSTFQDMGMEEHAECVEFLYFDD